MDRPGRRLSREASQHASPSRAANAPDRLLLSCEHAGNRIPKEYARLFRGAERLLASHRGWDPGALPVARMLARRFGVPLLAVSWSRLLVEANRSPTNRRIWSAFTAALPDDQRRRILDRYWWPHRRAVEAAVAGHAAAGRRVIHVAIHSFTAVLDGEVRNADVGLLYDPRRPGERALCGRWEEILASVAPELRVRRNYPYRGTSDGLPPWLHRRFADAQYVGVELELNQALLVGPPRRRVADAIGRSLGMLLDAGE